MSKKKRRWALVREEDGQTIKGRAMSDRERLEPDLEILKRQQPKSNWRIEEVHEKTEEI